MNSAGIFNDNASMNSKNIMNNIKISMIVLLWIVFLMNNTKMKNIYYE